MSLNAGNVRVAVTGAVYIADQTAANPTNATDPVPAGYRDVGYISEDGVTEAYSDDYEEIVAWQGATVVRTVLTSSSATLTFQVIETNKNSLELYHKGSQVTGSGPYVLKVKPPKQVRWKIIFDVIDGDKHIRLFSPDGEVGERGETVYANGEPVGYEVTVTAYPVEDDEETVEDGKQVVLYKFSDDSAWGAS